MKTTFKEIYKCNPDVHMWDNLCEKKVPDIDMEKEITLIEILNKDGIDGIIWFFWALRTQEYEKYSLLIKEIIEPVINKYKDYFPNGELERVIEIIQLEHDQKISEKEITERLQNLLVIFEYSDIKIIKNVGALVYCAGLGDKSYYNASDIFDALYYIFVQHYEHGHIIDELERIEKTIRKFLGK